MKKSTLLMLIAVLITLGCLTAYNFKLKEVYDTKEYKNRFRGMEFTPLNGVEYINVAAANLITMEIEQGEKEGVWIYTKRKQDITLKVTANHLDLGLTDAAIKGEYENNAIIVITKRLSSIISTPAFKGNCDTCIASSILVKNYRTNRLDLQVASNIIMTFLNMKANTLNARVGSDELSKSSLTLYQDSKIGNAYFDVPGFSLLDLENPEITKVSYKLSDSATVKLNGRPLKAIH